MLTLIETADLLERRLAPAHSEDPPAEGRWRAAVVMILRDPPGTPDDEGVEALFIKRAVNPRDYWSGHMALPGGRWQSEDATLLDTAIREAREEVGVDLSGSRVLGRLERLQPVSPYIPPVDITPYVAVAPEGSVVSPNHEVADHFWIPVELLRRVGPSAFYELTLADERRKWPAYPYRDNLIWGLTERILSRFLSLF
jgi:8-oxo-dGTP pyrophosphatase MutT (NUDIX family)